MRRLFHSIVMLGLAAATAAQAQTTRLTYRVADAQYSTALDRIVMTSSSPDQVHIFDPVARTESTVALSKPPLVISVAPDGKRAAVGHDGLISYVNLQTAAVERTFAVSSRVSNLVLGADWIWVLMASSYSGQTSYSVRISTGAVVPGSSSSAYSSPAQLTPDGKSLWMYQSGVTTIDVSGGVLGSSNNLLGTSCSSNSGYWLRFSPDGKTFYIPCAAYEVPASPSIIPTYVASLPATNYYSWTALAVTTEKLVGIGGSSDSDNLLYVLDIPYLQPSARFLIPDFVSPSRTFRRMSQR